MELLFSFQHRKVFNWTLRILISHLIATSRFFLFPKVVTTSLRGGIFNEKTLYGLYGHYMDWNAEKRNHSHWLWKIYEGLGRISMQKFPPPVLSPSWHHRWTFISDSIPRSMTSKSHFCRSYEGGKKITNFLSGKRFGKFGWKKYMLWTSMRPFSENFWKNYWQQLGVNFFSNIFFKTFFLRVSFKVTPSYFCPKTPLGYLL